MIGEKLFNSFIVATVFTVGDIFYRKIGGLSAGGRYSEPHTWNEIYELSPEFISLFIFFFIGRFIWESMKSKKNKKNTYICTKCGQPFELASNNKEAICKFCCGPAEISKGFYERHPELRDI
jgi:hypothetical protein